MREGKEDTANVVPVWAGYFIQQLLKWHEFSTHIYVP